MNYEMNAVKIQNKLNKERAKEIMSAIREVNEYSLEARKVRRSRIRFVVISLLVTYYLTMLPYIEFYIKKLSVQEMILVFALLPWTMASLAGAATRYYIWRCYEREYDRLRMQEKYAYAIRAVSVDNFMRDVRRGRVWLNDLRCAKYCAFSNLDRPMLSLNDLWIVIFNDYMKGNK